MRAYVCPHLPGDGCACRKPQPGLLLRAARDAGADIRTAWMAGDHDTDMAAARAAGCRLALHLTAGRQTRPSTIATVHLDGLHQLVRLLREAHPTSASPNPGPGSDA